MASQVTTIDGPEQLTGKLVLACIPSWFRESLDGRGSLRRLSEIAFADVGGHRFDWRETLEISQMLGNHVCSLVLDTPWDWKTLFRPPQCN